MEVNCIFAALGASSGPQVWHPPSKSTFTTVVVTAFLLPTRPSLNARRKRFLLVPLQSCLDFALSQPDFHPLLLHTNTTQKQPTLPFETTSPLPLSRAFRHWLSPSSCLPAFSFGTTYIPAPSLRERRLTTYDLRNDFSSVLLLFGVRSSTRYLLFLALPFLLRITKTSQQS